MHLINAAHPKLDVLKISFTKQNIELDKSAFWFGQSSSSEMSLKFGHLFSISVLEILVNSIALKYTTCLRIHYSNSLRSVVAFIL